MLRPQTACGQKGSSGSGCSSNVIWGRCCARDCPSTASRTQQRASLLLTSYTTMLARTPFMRLTMIACFILFTILLPDTLGCNEKRDFCFYTKR